MDSYNVYHNGNNNGRQHNEQSFSTTITNYPDDEKWIDDQVYINNTMAIDAITKGVATFDALNANVLPYNDTDANLLIFADSLTSQPIDLSVHTPADSIYLSFYYQPQGNGFNPETSDSLIVYLKRNTNTSAWVKAWSAPGNLVGPFMQVMVPVKDPQYFFDNFQFRFVNKATIKDNDDVWNVDYIRMAAGRNMNDTAIRCA